TLFLHLLQHSYINLTFSIKPPTTLFYNSSWTVSDDGQGISLSYKHCKYLDQLFYPLQLLFLNLLVINKQYYLPQWYLLFHPDFYLPQSILFSSTYPFHRSKGWQ